MLKLAGETESTREKIELISYQPGLQDTGDLEAGTNTITATSEASGVGNADYSKALTLSKPDDARLEVLRIVARYSVTRDSGTSNNTYMRIYVDQQDADHRLFDVDIQANALGAVDTYASALATIFNLLKDASAHTFYFFFWVDSGDAVISVVQLWEAVGTCNTGSTRADWQINHVGFLAFDHYILRVGSGTVQQNALVAFGGGYVQLFDITNTQKYACDTLCFSSGEIQGHLMGTVATDLNYTLRIRVILRSEQ